ncbi:MAG TPA: DUF6544 family protein [Allosphingosinicella sp.]|nr:DUF6544 family protein [Allosphingosinicella sp.]
MLQSISQRHGRSRGGLRGPRRKAAPAAYRAVRSRYDRGSSQRRAVLFPSRDRTGDTLYSTAKLEMEGTFLLGDKDRYQTFAMSARQVLRAPDQFVWMPRMRSSAMSITGSDALVDGEAWTRFWVLGVVPVAQDHTSPDLVRSAQFRAVVEGALSLPTSLLPANDVDWEQLNEHRARVTFRRFSPAIILEMILDSSGAVREVVGQRWSNANRDRTFRLQPFGGTMGADRTFQGLTIPTEIAAGNHYGTADYLPFFQVRLINATYS